MRLNKIALPKMKKRKDQRSLRSCIILKMTFYLQEIYTLSVQPTFIVPTEVTYLLLNKSYEVSLLCLSMAGVEFSATTIRSYQVL